MTALPQPGELVFVYGTLKQGGEYHWVMQKAGGSFIGEGKLLTAYPLVLDRYPCLLDEPGKGFQVVGEVYTIKESSGWEQLDWLEGHPEEYIRRPEMVSIARKHVQAWTYFYQWKEQLVGKLVPVEEFPIPDGSDNPV